MIQGEHEHTRSCNTKERKGGERESIIERRIYFKLHVTRIKRVYVRFDPYQKIQKEKSTFYLYQFAPKKRKVKETNRKSDDSYFYFFRIFYSCRIMYVLNFSNKIFVHFNQ